MSSTYSFGLPLKNNYVDFVHLEGFLGEQEVNSVTQLWDPDKMQAAFVHGETGPSQQDDFRRSNLIFLNPEPQLMWLYERLGRAAVENNNYRYHFDLLGFHESLQLAKYDQQDHFDWHMDFGVGMNSSRKLSLSVQLSDGDSYEGGDLQFMINNQVYNAPRVKGTLVLFPSYLMHRVTPITAGVRMSIVGWVTGPPFR